MGTDTPAGKVKPGFIENATGGGITYAGGGKPGAEKRKEIPPLGSEVIVHMFIKRLLKSLTNLIEFLVMVTKITQSVCVYLVCWGEEEMLLGDVWG